MCPQSNNRPHQVININYDWLICDLSLHKVHLKVYKSIFTKHDIMWVKILNCSCIANNNKNSLVLKRNILQIVNFYT